MKRQRALVIKLKYCRFLGFWATFGVRSAAAGRFGGRAHGAAAVAGGGRRGDVARGGHGRVLAAAQAAAPRPRALAGRARLPRSVRPAAPRRGSAGERIRRAGAGGLQAAAVSHIAVSNALLISGMLTPKFGFGPFFGTGLAAVLSPACDNSLTRSHAPDSALWATANE